MYNDLNKLCKEMDKISTSSLIISGRLTQRSGKVMYLETALASGQEEEEMIADPRSKLVEFCEMSNKVIVNSCLHHPANLITTWSQKTINPTTKIVTNM